MYNPVGTRQLSAFTARAMILVPELQLVDGWADAVGASGPDLLDGPAVAGDGVADDGVAPPSRLER